MTSFPPLPPDDDYVIDSEESPSQSVREFTLLAKLYPLTQPMRHKIVYGGRGSTKSWTIARLLLLMGTQKPLLIACCRETMQSMTDSVHRLLKEQIQVLGLDSVYTVQQSKIVGPSFTEDGKTRRTEFIFAGLRDDISKIKSMEGVDILWVEEAADVSQESWDVVLPTIRKANSEIWVSFNPRMVDDPTYKMFVLNPQPNSVLIEINYTENPWLTEELRIQSEYLKVTDPVKYAHVWEGKPISETENAIFGDEMKRALKENRIGDIPVDLSRPVDWAFDLGFGDYTCAWGVQRYGGYFNFVDYISGTGRVITDYLLEIQQKPYLHGVDYLPHDSVDAILHKKLAGGARHANSTEVSIEEIVRQVRTDSNLVRVVPKINIVNRIDNARRMFNLCRFNSTKCGEGIKALRMYRRGKANKDGVTSREPVHDKYSHPADALQYALIAIREARARQVEAWRPPQYAGGVKSTSWS